MLVVLSVSVAVTVAVDAGGGVIVRIFESLAEDIVLECLWPCFRSGSSQHPKKIPGVSQVSESEVVLVGVLWTVVVSHPPPSQPDLHDVETEAVVEAGTDDVLEAVGASVVVVTVRFADSLHPNQPGVRQVVVVYVVVATGCVLVVPSRQPHHPGVLQVLVLVYVILLVVVLVVVVVSEPLLSKNLQLKQSRHSLSGTHFGTVLYFLITSSMTS